MSFGDRIVAVNKLAANSLGDVQHVLDTTQTMTVEFLAQPWFVNCRLSIKKNRQLDGLVLHGRTVESVTRGSVADASGVMKGFALLSVDGESVLGEENSRVDFVMRQYLASKQRYLSLMFCKESEWVTLKNGIELILKAAHYKNTSVAKYVSNSLCMDRSLKDPELVQRVDLGEPHEGRHTGRHNRSRSRLFRHR
ncbi:hypothetical protein SARC_13412 [Sphaeroforma arctica JP610]|uniref:PDZ domain-containing protein n=1 Tax=Sphaeroforma arctica JP610 TaxID=667725 RepID=A0A0L0FB95_9EUKA|nr:hypothetical protein SARC_13412 [Sphaeroforma arctica JP610]KNC74030.1 hypothetical protein SARC_13412 [Sphaeroforma arctica JP610]|eukprot:XP_014147932.1 hypothetical protein SARC_13412 [Sphaeroforma arctica JP610]